MSQYPTGGVKITLVSDPGIKRVGTGPLWAAIGVGLAFSMLWLIVAAGVLPHNFFWSIIMASAACAFSTLLIYTGYSIIRDQKRRFTLELTDCEAVLTVVDGMHNRKATQMVLVDDIVYAEYYPYRDSATIILHTHYARMEVPLWPMGEKSQDALDFLAGRGVNIVNVQSDDPVPDMVIK